MFSSSRLTLARQRLGWTLSRLAAESGVSARSLSAYENDHGYEPSLETLEKLSSALRVPVAFLSREPVDPVPPEAISFRKLSKTSATKRDAVLATANVALEFFTIVERHFALPLPTIPTLDKNPPEEAAEIVRHRWNLGDKPISNMVHLLESKGVRVAGLAHEFNDIDAFCFYRDSKPYVFLDTSRSGERQRFDAAHELGHLVLHDAQDMTPTESKAREAEANRFASSFLMPRSSIFSQSMSAASLERILAARKYWKVSAMALTHRLHDLGLLGDWQYRSMCITLSDLGYRSSEPDGMVPETSLLLRKVMFGESRLRLKDAASELALDTPDLSRFLHGLVPVAAF